MRFTPKTDEQIKAEQDAALGIWEAGWYDFEIGDGLETTSKAGNDMIELSISVYDQAGNRKSLKDYLVEAMAFKLKRCCEACGLLDRYQRGDLRGEMFNGKTGRLRLGIEKGKPNNDGSGNNYPDKNRIEEYEKPKPGTARAASRQAVPSGDLNDEVPF
jgi:hypothetical protein